MWKLKQRQSFVSHYISKHLVTTSNDFLVNILYIYRTEIITHICISNPFFWTYYIGRKIVATSVMLIQIYENICIRWCNTSINKSVWTTKIINLNELYILHLHWTTEAFGLHCSHVSLTVKRWRQKVKSWNCQKLVKSLGHRNRNTLWEFTIGNSLQQFTDRLRNHQINLFVSHFLKTFVCS